MAYEFSKLGPATDPPVYPTYIEDAHRQWLDGTPSPVRDGVPGQYSDYYPYNMRALLESALRNADVAGEFGPPGPGSPYYNAVVYDPSDDLGNMDARLAAFVEAVDVLDPIADWGTFVDAAAAKKAVVVDDSTAIDSAVDAFDEKEKGRLYGALNSFAGAMFEARATQNSQFVVGMFQLQAEHTRRVAEHRSELERQSKRLETMHIMQSTQELSRLFMGKLDQLRTAAAQQNETGRLRIIAGKEYHEDELRLEVEDAFYEMELMKFGNSALSAVAGLATQPPRLPKAQSAMAGALAAAPIALQLGAINPALGIAAVALAGGASWLGGY